jgi:5-amino-6-(5-phosphoribosylamino)uracil reductase/diaminohydroxyphosphoribosylaminopyrimidine deaminase/5-amino-6-(5-phosphoribosylamino)uracil reductase
VRIDDPQLTVRACPGRSPRRVVLASSLNVSPGARVFENGPELIVIGTIERASAEARARLERHGAHVCVVPAGADGLVSLSHALEALRDRGIERLLVEGGARTLTSFLRERRAHEATVEIAPTFFGEPALPAFGALRGLEAIHLVDLLVERADGNVVVRGRIAY